MRHCRLMSVTFCSLRKGNQCISTCRNNYTYRSENPSKSFKGRVLAGIHVSPKEEAETENATEGAQIKNRIAYNLAVVLQESQETIEPDLKLLSGDLDEVNAKPTVQLRFQNPQPRIISNLIFTSKIFMKISFILKIRLMNFSCTKFEFSLES